MAPFICKDCGATENRKQRAMRCISCWNKWRATSRHAQWMADKRTMRKHTIMSRYGLSMEDYDRLCKAADGKCEICARDNIELVVDHDHSRENGGVRGIICRACNLLLGYARDNPVVLMQAITYLAAANVFWTEFPEERHALSVR